MLRVLGFHLKQWNNRDPGPFIIEPNRGHNEASSKVKLKVLKSCGDLILFFSVLLYPVSSLIVKAHTSFAAFALFFVYTLFTRCR